MRLLIFGAMTLMAIGSVKVSKSQSYCWPADRNAQALWGWMRDIATRTDSVYIATRDSLDIPFTTESKVSIVTSERTCQDAAEAFSAVMGVAPPGGRRVYVIKVNNVYFVQDPSERMGEFTVAMVFTSKWVFVKRIVG